MTRHEIREHLFKELFLTEFHHTDEYEEQCKIYREDIEGASEEEKEELMRKADAILSERAQIDAAINKVSEGWKTGRMGKVELTILRLAYYEMTRDESVPVKVAINEAVELAKTYGGDDSPAFVNAILGKLSRLVEE